MKNKLIIILIFTCFFPQRIYCKEIRIGIWDGPIDPDILSIFSNKKLLKNILFDSSNSNYPQKNLWDYNRDAYNSIHSEYCHSHYYNLAEEIFKKSDNGKIITQMAMGFHGDNNELKNFLYTIHKGISLYHATHISGTVIGRKTNKNGNFLKKLFPQITSIKIVPLPMQDNLVRIENIPSMANKDILSAIQSINNQYAEKIINIINSTHLRVVNVSITLDEQKIKNYINIIFSESSPSERERFFQSIIESQKSNLTKIFEKNPNVIFVVAAGNKKSGEASDINQDKNHIASIKRENVVIVSGNDVTNENGFSESYSKFGNLTVDISAPGKDIISFKANGKGKKTMRMTGSSMATAVVSHEIAKIIAKNSKLSSLEIIEILFNKVAHPNKNLENKIIGGKQIEDPTVTD